MTDEVRSERTTLAHAGATAVIAEQIGDRLMWEIGNDRIVMRLVWSPGEGLGLERIGRADGASIAGAGGLFDLTWSGLPVATAPDLRLLGANAASDGDHVTLTVRLATTALTITLNLRCYDGLGVIRQWLEVEAGEGGVLSDVAPLCVALSTDQPPSLATVAGVQRQGGWRPESGLYRSFRLEERTLVEPVFIESGLRSTWDETPWYAVTLADEGSASGGIFGGLEYSGRWRLNGDYTADGVTRVALRPVGYETRLAPGERWVSPVAWVGVFAGDLDDASKVQHDYHRRVLAPPLPDDFPWVQYNSWYAYSCDIDAETLLADARIAADLGVEVFYVDAGWWDGHPRGRQGGFSTGLGTWIENRAKFPNGLGAFFDEIRALGMHAGLWVEPERVDLRTASAAGWRTEWLATSGGRYVRADWPSDTDTAWLCFGSPEVQAWTTDWICRLVETLGLRWLKWDSNYWGVCDRVGHGHGPGDGEAAQVAGVHAVLDALRASFPDLIIENCAGGGTRMDFAMAARTHVAWVSDATDPAHRVRFHLHGASRLFPPAMLNSWLVESVYEDLDGRDQPEDILRAMVRSRMLGAFGLSCCLTSWTEATRRVVREEIAAYKQDRHLFRNGYVYHLLLQPPLVCPDLRAPDAWEAYEFRSGNSGLALVYAFRNAAIEDEIALPLRGLDSSSRYQVSQDGGETVVTTGAGLTTRGIAIRLAPLTSARYRVRRLPE